MELIVALGFAALGFECWWLHHRWTEFAETLINSNLEMALKLSKVSHDLQQIKVRLHWSREREIKDVKAEYAGTSTDSLGKLPSTVSTATGKNIKYRLK